MPIHDWTRVEAGIFHHFHHSWIEEIARSLNRGLLPPDFYAMAEQFAGDFGPDVLPLHAPEPRETNVAVHHVSGDRVVAMVEVVSPGNKSTRHALEQFVRKVAELVNGRVQLLILDVLPPGRHDASGIHSAIWEYIAGQEFAPPENKPLTLAAYGADLEIRAYLENVAVGDDLPDMPLFLQPDSYISVPLEVSYQAAWEAVPRRWRRVIETSG
jgi:hypothetical protein